MAFFNCSTDPSVCLLPQETLDSSSDRIKIEHEPVDLTRIREVVKRLNNLPRISSVALNFDGITDEALCLSDLVPALIETSVDTLELFGNRIGLPGPYDFCSTLGQHLSHSALAVSTLKLGGNMISDQGASEIAAGLANNSTLKQLNLSNNLIGDGGIHQLVTSLKGNSTLTSLVLRKNRFGAAGVHELSKLLCDPACRLAELQVKHNALGSRGEFLQYNRVLSVGIISLVHAISINQTLQVLDLEQTYLTPADAKELAEALKSNKVIHAVNLNDNEIADVGADAFGNLLKVNSAITTLGMRNNRITVTGCCALFAGIEENANLTGLDIAGNRIMDKGVAVISEVLVRNSCLRSLDIRSNCISPEGMMKVTCTLEKGNSTITHLDISSNYCGNDTVWRWANVILHNTSLSRLSLDNCEITKGHVLLSAMQNNTTLCYFGCGGKRNGIPKSIKTAIKQLADLNLALRSQQQQQNRAQIQKLGADGAQCFPLTASVTATPSPPLIPVVHRKGSADHRLGGIVPPLIPSMIANVGNSGGDDLAGELSDINSTPTNISGGRSSGLSTPASIYQRSTASNGPTPVDTVQMKSHLYYSPGARLANPNVYTPPVQSSKGLYYTPPLCYTSIQQNRNGSNWSGMADLMRGQGEGFGHQQAPGMYNPVPKSSSSAVSNTYLQHGFSEKNNDRWVPDQFTHSRVSRFPSESMNSAFFSHRPSSVGDLTQLGLGLGAAVPQLAFPSAYTPPASSSTRTASFVSQQRASALASRTPVCRRLFQDREVDSTFVVPANEILACFTPQPSTKPFLSKSSSSSRLHLWKPTEAETFESPVNEVTLYHAVAGHGTAMTTTPTAIAHQCRSNASPEGVSGSISRTSDPLIAASSIPSSISLPGEDGDVLRASLDQSIPSGVGERSSAKDSSLLLPIPFASIPSTLVADPNEQELEQPFSKQLLSYLWNSSTSEVQPA